MPLLWKVNMNERKKCILSAEEIRRQPPVELMPVVLDPHDPSLPAARGEAFVVKHQPKASEMHQMRRLARTKSAGGLIDDYATVDQPSRAQLIDKKEAK
jgi:hypothetical protein